MRKLSICIRAGILASMLLLSCKFPLTLTPTPTSSPSLAPATVSQPTFPPEPTRLPTATDTPAPTPTPTPPPLPPFVGRLLVVIDKALYWLTGEGETAQLSEPLAQNIELATVSPDGRYLAYSIRGEVTNLMDLSSGEVRQLSPTTSQCFSWSPDNSHFTYTVEKGALELYQADPDGAKVKIAQTPCKKYGGGVTGNVDPHNMCGELTCGAWLDESHLLFQRFQGEMPGFVTIKSGVPVQLQSQLTTLATVNSSGGQATRLVDLAERWYEVERCNAGPYVLLRKERDGDVYLSPTFTDLSGLQASPLPGCEDCYPRYPARFADAQCNILQRHHPAQGSDWLTLTDPASLEVILSTKELFSLFNFGYKDVVWAGEAQERIMALTTFSQKGVQITLIDLHNGVKAVLVEMAMEMERADSYVLGWMGP